MQPGRLRGSWGPSKLGDCVLCLRCGRARLRDHLCINISGRDLLFRPAQGFFAEVREVDRDNEVNRILGAFKLNPFEQLGIRFDATLDDAKRQYRKASLLVRAASPQEPEREKERVQRGTCIGHAVVREDGQGPGPPGGARRVCVL